MSYAANGADRLGRECVIAFLDANDAHHLRAVAALSAILANQLVLPASAYAEILVRPYRQGAQAVAIVEQFIAALAIRVEPASREIAKRAAEVRSQPPSLRLPDALVLATGDVLDATEVLTADTSWPRFSARARMI